MTKILLLSQSKSLLNSLSERLRFENFMTDEVDDSQRATEMCQAGKFDVVIADDQMDIANVELPTIVITRQPNIDAAVEALRHGAIDYLCTPIDMNRLLGTLRTLNSSEDTPTLPRRTTRSSAKRTHHATQHIIGESAAIERVRTMINRVAPSNARVLILGENGTG